MVVDWEWPHPSAENSGCRSEDGDDMAGVPDWGTILSPRHWKVPLPFAGECEMGYGHSGHNVMAGRTAERTHCDIHTEDNTLSCDREVAGWPSLPRNDMR